MIKLTVITLVSSIVIADFGSTKDLKNYIGHSETVSPATRKATVETVTDSINNKFPLSTRLSLQNTNTFEVSEKFKSLNMALISDEPASLNWLNRNYKKLKSTGATVALIKVESLSNYQNLKSILDKAGLNLALLDSSVFGSEITSYPVLIQNGEVSQ